MAPRLRKLIEISDARPGGCARRTGGSGSFSFSAEYEAVFRQLSIGGAVQSLVVVLTVFFMATHAGA